MVACRSCGRNISSGTIRCSKCSTPFHLSCSHRYKISPDGVFNVCCGPADIAFPGNGTFQMRTRNRNKRRQQQQQQIQPQQQQTNNQQSQDDSMRYGKIQKTSDNTMGINEKPNLHIEDEPNVCTEIIQEDENFQDNENNLSNFNSELRNSVEILNESVDNEADQSESHTTTVNSTIANIEANNKITLETVWQGISSLQNSISNISNSLDTVSNQLNTIDPRIIELESSLNTIKAKTTNFDNMQNDVSGLRGELEHITNEIENLKSSQQEKNFDMGEIFSEIRERDIKSRNILIYNVPEVQLRLSQDYSTLEEINKFNALMSARDKSRAREILEPVANIELDEIETKRLGRVNNPNYVRPLRVTLQSRDDVITVMKNRSLINKTYTVKTDLTKLQQKKIKTLKEELEKMAENQPHPTMTIKFINGEPKLIPIVRRNLKNE